MTKIVPSDFILPTPQEALGGELGLTSFDIARSLGLTNADGHIQQQSVKDKIRRNLEFFEKNNFHVSTWIAPRIGGGGGRGQENYVVSVATAKYIVAGWKSDRGASYFHRLLACERAAEEVIPQMLAENERLKSLVNALTEKKTRTPVRKTKSDGVQRTLVVESMTRYDSLFGEEGEVFQRHFKRVPVENLTHEEWLDAQYTMLFLQHQGITRRMGEVKDALDFERTRKTNVVLLPRKVEDGQP
jgi:hypothetical protein